MILYAVKIPFMDGWIYLTEGSGSNTHHKFFKCIEEADERAKDWKGKVVEVVFNEDFEEGL